MADQNRMSPETWTLRQQVLRKYGGRCRCTCGCQSANLRHLQFDHIDGGGTQERLKFRGNKLYQKLYREPVIKQLRLLCANCHFEISQHGECLGVTYEESIPYREVTESDQEHSQPEKLQEVSVVAVDPFAHTREEGIARMVAAHQAERLAERARTQKPRSSLWGRIFG
jgi:hypothetical protein